LRCPSSASRRRIPPKSFDSRQQFAEHLTRHCHFGHLEDGTAGVGDDTHLPGCRLLAPISTTFSRIVVSG
jgi:hypothetical protein